jgi:RNA 3'-terminal phosphate cyclase (ATP)
MRIIDGSFGEVGGPISAHRVTARVAHLPRHIAEREEVPVGRHLGDQLVLLNAIAGGGTFRTLSPTTHLITQLEVIRAFLGINVRLDEESTGAWRVEVPAG